MDATQLNQHKVVIHDQQTAKQKNFPPRPPKLKQQKQYLKHCGPAKTEPQPPQQLKQPNSSSKLQLDLECIIL
jgi:hypothetical protein